MQIKKKPANISQNSLLELRQFRGRLVIGIILLVCFFVAYFPVWKRLILSCYRSEDEAYLTGSKFIEKFYPHFLEYVNENQS